MTAAYQVPTLCMIVEALLETYSEDGVAIYLSAFNYELEHRPIDLCRTPGGRVRVYEVVSRLGDHDEHGRRARGDGS